MKGSSSFSDDDALFSDKNALWIDVASKNELISSLIFFIIILFSLFYFCFNSNQDIIINNYQTHGYYISKTNIPEIQKFDFDLTPFNSNNRFVRLYLSFGRNTTYEFSENVTFHYFIRRLSYKEVKEEKITKKITLFYHLDGDKNWTDEYNLFSDYVIDFQSLSLGLFINKTNTSFTKFEFGYMCGSLESTMFNIYFRIAFTLLHIITFFLLFYNKKLKDVKFFLPEQILVFPLIIITIICNNPFCIYKYFYPTKLYYKWMLYTLPINDSAIYFTTFMLFIFYSYRISDRKNVKMILCGHSKSRENNFTKISIISFIVCLIHMIILIILNHYIGKYLFFNNFPTLNERKKYLQIMRLKAFVAIIFSLFGLIFALSSLAIINVVAAPLFAYLTAYVIVFIQVFLFEGLFIILDFISDKDESYVLLSKLIVQNFYCFFITYLQWPYDIREQCSQVSLEIASYVAHDDNKGMNETFADLLYDN